MLTAILPSASDPRVLLKSGLEEHTFTESVSALKFGTTFKTTKKTRFPLSIKVLATTRYSRLPVILDVGASDGITSMDVMKAVRFRQYFVTDRHMEVFACKRAGKSYFFASDGTCVLIATDAWIIYEDTMGALPVFGSIARSFLSHAPKLSSDAKKIDLITPALQAQLPPDVRVEQYDIFEKWPHDKVDLVIAANILFRGYFSEQRLTQALGNLLAALNEGGRLAIIENRDIEKATLFRLSAGRAIVERQVNGGTEIESLVKALPSPSIPLPMGEGRKPFSPREKGGDERGAP